MACEQSACVCVGNLLTSLPGPGPQHDAYVSAADELLPTLRQALDDDTVSVVACPVDYSANSALIASLGELDESWS